MSMQAFLDNKGVQDPNDLSIADVKESIVEYECKLMNDGDPAAPEGWFDRLRECLSGAKETLRLLREEAGLDPEEVDMQAEEAAMFPDGRDPDSEDPDDFGGRNE